MSKFKLGATVEWTSSSGGSSKTKRGQVEVIVPAGSYVEKLTTELNWPGGPRYHESYLIRVHGKTARSKGKLYWPVVSRLVLVKQEGGSA